MSCSTKLKTYGLTKFAVVMAISMPAMVHAEEVLRSFPAVKQVTTSSQSVASDALALVVDFAVVLQIDGNIGSIILGNAAIVDAVVSDGKIIVLTGKVVGITNMIVLDASNEILARTTLHVTGRKPGTITVRRALKPESYACDDGLCSSSLIEAADMSANSKLPPS